MGLTISDIALAGLRVLVVGLAREGSAAARFLAEHGVIVAVTDAKPAPALTAPLAGLQDLAIDFYLGGHPADLLNPGRTDLLVVSPGVPLDSPFLQQASAVGLPLTTESRLFCQLCPAPTVGITGSSGKTTTTTLVGLMLEAAGYTTHVGGNIGTPLIARLGQVRAEDRAVLELSSFQLEYFRPNPTAADRILAPLRPLLTGWSPQVGAILNITPNHLDRHGTMAAYTQAKLALVQSMGPGQTAVLNFDNQITRAAADQTEATIAWFSRARRVERGACLIDGQITLVNEGRLIPICPVREIKLRGEHNIDNVLAACAIAGAAGATPAAMTAVATSFSGVPHRLERVAVQDGVAYYNDSIATSPERLMAALRSFDEPIILLAGGKDKDLPWAEAARLILARVKHLLLFGYSGPLIAAAVERERQGQLQPQSHLCSTLEEAVEQARRLAQSGDVVLLSPGGTSYDAYPDFAARGDHFRALVQ